MSEFERYPNYQKYQGKNLLAIDYGTKVLGLAVFCPGKDPYPYPFDKIINKGEEQVLSQIAQTVENECIELIIVGLPLYLDGNESDMTATVREFFGKLRQEIPTIEMTLQDETLSTSEAEERMKNSPRYNFKVDPKQIDALAASIILEDFIRQE